MFFCMGIDFSVIWNLLNAIDRGTPEKGKSRQSGFGFAPTFRYGRLVKHLSELFAL